MIDIEQMWVDRVLADIHAARLEELAETEAMQLAMRIMMTHVADFLAHAVVKEFMNELSGPAFAQMRWKARQRLVRLLARRGRALGR